MNREKQEFIKRFYLNTKKSNRNKKLKRKIKQQIKQVNGKKQNKVNI